MRFTQLREQRQTGHRGQFEVGDEASDIVQRAAAQQRFRGCVGRRAHPSRIQQRFDCFSHAFVILDHEHPDAAADRHVGSPCSLPTERPTGRIRSLCIVGGKRARRKWHLVQDRCTKGQETRGPPLLAAGGRQNRRARAGVLQADGRAFRRRACRVRQPRSTPSFSINCARYALTVRRLTPSSSAICLLSLPATTRSKIARSRGVNTARRAL